MDIKGYSVDEFSYSVRGSNLYIFGTYRVGNRSITVNQRIDESNRSQLLPEYKAEYYYSYKKVLGIVQRGSKNSRVLLADGTTDLFKNSWLYDVNTNAPIPFFGRPVANKIREILFGACNSLEFDELTFGFELEVCIPSRKLGEFARKAFDQIGLLDRHTDYRSSDPNYWTLGYDASVRGRSSLFFGGEIQSPVFRASNMEQRKDELKKLIRILDEVGGQVNKTCGFHMHVGFRDSRSYKSTWTDPMWSAFQRFERPFFDKLVSASRRGTNNHYLDTTIGRSFNTNHYSKLSFTRWGMQGTVEFRSHQGTTNYNKIVNWMELCGRFCLSAIKNPAIPCSEINSGEDVYEVCRNLGCSSEVCQFYSERYEELN